MEAATGSDYDALTECRIVVGCVKEIGIGSGAIVMTRRMAIDDVALAEEEAIWRLIWLESVYRRSLRLAEAAADDLYRRLSLSLCEILISRALPPCVVAAFVNESESANEKMTLTLILIVTEHAAHHAAFAAEASWKETAIMNASVILISSLVIGRDVSWAAVMVIGDDDPLHHSICQS